MATSGYVDDNGVFLNKFSITNPEVLQEVEYQITARQARDWEDRQVDIGLGFGLMRLQAIHLHLMGEIYEWAGRIRSVPSRKHGSFGSITEFADPSNIENDWNELGEKVSTFLLNEKTLFDDNLDQLVDIFVAANQIHPFPEGNGRSQQVFMRDLASEINIELDYSNISRDEWNEACSVCGNHGKLFEHQIFIPAKSDTTKIKAVFRKIAKTRESEDSDISEKNEFWSTPSNGHKPG